MSQKELLKTTDEDSFGFKLFSYFIEERFEGNLEIPTWQRGLQWSLFNQKTWNKNVIKCASMGRSLLSTIVTCDIEENINPGKLLFDGNQRTSSVIYALKNPAKYKIDKEELQAAIKKVNVPHVYTHFKTNEEAAYAFQEVNKTTGVKPYDLCKIPLVLMEIWPKIEKEFQLYYSFFITEFQKYSSTPNNLSYEKMIKQYRYALCFFWFWYIDTSLNMGYPITTYFLPSGPPMPSDYLEKQVAFYLKDRTYIDIKYDLEKLIEIVSAELRLIDKIWEEYLEKRKIKINENTVIMPHCLRIILQLAFWRKKNKKSEEQWELWVSSFFKINKGSSKWSVIENKEEKNRNILRLSRNMTEEIFRHTDSRVFYDFPRKKILTKKVDHGAHIGESYNIRPEQQELIAMPKLRNLGKGTKAEI